MTTDEAWQRSAQNAAACLAAAEIAVRHGNFNTAKILRAVALSERINAVELAKLATADVPEGERLRALLNDYAQDGDRGEAGERSSSRATVHDLLRRAVDSLGRNPDVLESDVNQFLWGCHLCGAVSEGRRPETCPACGAPPPDLELFAPFFAQSSERIGRLAPGAIIETLRATPGAVAAAVTALGAHQLDVKPSESEWSAREIIAHMTETDLLFAQRALAILSDPPGVIDGNVRPWVLHHGKGYEGLSPDELLARHDAARAETLAIVTPLSAADWARPANLRGAPATLLDFGAWIANHDTGHLAQLHRKN